MHLPAEHVLQQYQQALAFLTTFPCFYLSSHPFHPPSAGRWLSGHSLCPDSTLLQRMGKYQCIKGLDRPGLQNCSRCQHIWEQQPRHSKEHRPGAGTALPIISGLEPRGSVLAVLGSPPLLGDGFCNKIWGVWQPTVWEHKPEVPTWVEKGRTGSCAPVEDDTRRGVALYFSCIEQVESTQASLGGSTGA